MNAPTPSTARSRRDQWICLLAAGGGLGYLPKAPGTFGSLLGPLLFWLQTQRISHDPRWLLVVFVGSLNFLIGVWLSERAIRVSGQKDPQFVVCDEFFAFAWVYLFTPLTWTTAVLGFLWFRLFDITKPGPVGWAEKLPGGWGVMADDAMAGLLAGGCLWGTMQWIGMW